MSIAVEHERFILAATSLSGDILSVNTDDGKPFFSSGGGS
jgi:hypothetical protein